MMTDPRRQRWYRYVRRIADIIRLRDWTVCVYDLQADQCNDAEINCVGGRKFGGIYLSERFLDVSPESARHTILHELIHCHFAPYVKAVEERTGKDRVLGDLMEYAVDGLTDAFAPFMPLPGEKAMAKKKAPTKKSKPAMPGMKPAKKGKKDCPK